MKILDTVKALDTPTRHNHLFEQEYGEKDLKLQFLRDKCRGESVKKLLVRDECRDYVLNPRKYARN